MTRPADDDAIEVEPDLEDAGYWRELAQREFDALANGEPGHTVSKSYRLVKLLIDVSGLALFHPCQVCGQATTPSRRSYCSSACREKAYRRRHR